MEDNSVLTLEDGFLKTGDSILFESETRNEPFVGGGRMISESAVNAPSRTAERSFVKEINTQLVTKPTPRITRNKFVYLAKTPFDKRFGGSSAIQLENDTTGVFNTGLLLTDGEIPLNESILNESSSLALSVYSPENLASLLEDKKVMTRDEKIAFARQQLQQSIN